MKESLRKTQATARARAHLAKVVYPTWSKSWNTSRNQSEQISKSDAVSCSGLWCQVSTSATHGNPASDPRHVQGQGGKLTRRHEEGVVQHTRLTCATGTSAASCKTITRVTREYQHADLDIHMQTFACNTCIQSQYVMNRDLFELMHWAYYCKYVHTLPYGTDVCVRPRRPPPCRPARPRLVIMHRHGLSTQKNLAAYMSRDCCMSLDCCTSAWNCKVRCFLLL